MQASDAVQSQRESYIWEVDFGQDSVETAIKYGVKIGVSKWLRFRME